MLGKLYEARKNTIGGDRGNQYTKVAGVENRHMASPSGNKTRATIAAEQGTTESAVRDASFYAKGLDAAEEANDSKVSVDSFFDVFLLPICLPQIGTFFALFCPCRVPLLAFCWLCRVIW